MDLVISDLLFLFFTDITSRDGDVAQLVEHGIGTPLTRVRFPGAARDFSPRVNSQCKLSVHPRVQPHASTCVRTLKIL